MFGRAVLFRLSSFMFFLLTLAKDLMYQIYHFGVKYVETVMVFTIKAAHPEGKSGFTKFYMKVIRYSDMFVRFAGVPKTLAISFTHTIDYRDTLKM